MTLTDERTPKIKNIFQAKMETVSSTKVNHDILNRFKRAIRRLRMLSKFANLLGEEIDVEDIEIANLTNKGKKEKTDFDEGQEDETEEQKEKRILFHRVIEELSLDNMLTGPQLSRMKIRHKRVSRTLQRATQNVKQMEAYLEDESLA